jgi:hypothetical protein
MKALVAGLALLAASPAPAQTLPGPGPVESAALAVSRSTASLDAELAQLDGGPLTQALESAARQGRRLRLVLDPRQRPTRQEGSALSALSPTVEIRWRKGAGRPLRWLLSDGALALAWDPASGARAPGDGALAALNRERFELRWAQASADLPEGLRLDDQLKSLPDPSEGQPHYIRRRQGAGAGDDDHADPASPQPQGP